MTTFKVGDLVVPKDKEQREAILSQASYSISFPCRVIAVDHSGAPFLYVKKSNGDKLGLYAYRFSKAPPMDKPLEEYL